MLNVHESIDLKPISPQMQVGQKQQMCHLSMCLCHLVSVKISSSILIIHDYTHNVTQVAQWHKWHGLNISK